MNKEYYCCSSLTSIKIPNSVTTIEWNIFSGCKALTSIEIPNSVTTIGQYAFYGCSSLTSIEIPSSVTTIEMFAFEKCNALTEITCLMTTPCKADILSFNENQYENTLLIVPNQSKTLYRKTFCWENFVNIKGIEVSGEETPSPYDYDFIANGIYYKITDIFNLEASVTCGEKELVGDVEIPETVEYKGKELTVTSVGGLFGSKELSSVKIPSTVKTIDDDAFRSCTNLSKIVIPASVSNVGDKAFYNCRALKELIIEEGTDKGIQFIGSEHFGYCPLKKVYIGRNYSYDTFKGNTSLEEVTFGKSVSRIASESFEGCTSLSFIKIPNSVTYIGEYAFKNCKNLATIEIPQNVNSIGRDAFSGCTNLENLVIAKGTSNLRFDTNIPFTGCNIKNIYYGRNCYYGFTNYKITFPNITTLEKLTISDEVTEIADGMFKGCASLKEIYCENPNPCTLADAFDTEQYLEATVYVPKGSLEAYQNAYGWKSFWNIEESDITGIDSVTSDNQSAKIKGIYTLSGQKVNNTIPGNIYIFIDENGRKVKRLVK